MAEKILGQPTEDKGTIAVLVSLAALGLCGWNLTADIPQTESSNLLRFRVTDRFGRDLVCDRVVPAGIGFVVGRAKYSWGVESNASGIYTSELLPDGEHIFLLAGWTGKTAIRVRVPRPQRVLIWQPRMFPDWSAEVRDSLVSREHVEVAPNGDEVIVFNVRNTGNTTVQLRPEDIRFIVCRYDMLVSSPRVLPGNNGAPAVMGDEGTKWIVPPGGRTQIRVNWPACVRIALWSWGDTNGPYLDPKSDRHVGVRPCIRNSRGVGVILRDPALIARSSSHLSD